jgi:hypothetical protein
MLRETIKAVVVIVALLMAGLQVEAQSPRLQMPRVGDIVSAKFYDSFRHAECSNVDVCLVEFAKVPDNVLLRAAHLNCYVTVQLADTQWIVVRLFQGPIAQAESKDTFTATPLNPGGLPAAFSVNAPILTFFKGGKKPIAYISATFTAETISVNCKISGDLVAP